MALAATGLAVPFTFQVIPDSGMSPIDAAIGELQLLLDVTDAGPGRVLFTYTNVGPDACSLTDVFVDDGSLLELATVHNTPGLVEFTEAPSPSNLPRGGNLTPPFDADSCFSADSDPPIQPMGVNPGESLGIEYTLEPGGTFAHVLAELDDGRLRIGLHVQGFAGGGSEAFILVPEPATLCVLALAVPALARRTRRQR